MNENLAGSIENNVHHFPVRVYYSDTDAGGIVYHSRYIDMAEHGRTEFLRCLGGDQNKILNEQAIAFVVKTMEIDYKSPGLLDDLLTVKTKIAKCENFTIIFHQEICRDGDLLTTLSVKVGSVSLENGRPTLIPENIKSELTLLFNR